MYEQNEQTISERWKQWQIRREWISSGSIADITFSATWNRLCKSYFQHFFKFRFYSSELSQNWKQMNDGSDAVSQCGTVNNKANSLQKRHTRTHHEINSDAAAIVNQGLA